MKKLTLFLAITLLTSCATRVNKPINYDFWKSANLYFLMTDRFSNGDKSNDVNFGRTEKTGVLRGFEGGDLRGIINKIDENYFTDLGVNAIWMTPIVEQIHGATNEGTGNTYGFHGYWTKDWSEIDPNFGTKTDLKELVDKAHQKGIKVILDAVINHTGPVTKSDEVYPNSWVRTSPQCTYNNYEHTTACTLVANLPDILTESNSPAELPTMLVEKWKKEGKYSQEIASLDAFFAKNKLPRAPKFYIMKWLTDYIREYGIDGYRIDTAKHVNEDTWKVFQQLCQEAFDQYKANHPNQIKDNTPFFTVGEVYGYGISQKQNYNFGDRIVNYYNNGFSALINFDFKGDANQSYEKLFSNYDQILKNDLNGFTVMNYLTSHDDSWPFDKKREKTYEAGTKLLLTPGISQIYYGDETARSLEITGTQGDATLRSNMNWQDVKTNPETQKLLAYYQKLGKFRAEHPAIGAGKHQLISKNPYWFSRKIDNIDFSDKVYIGLDLPKGIKSVAIPSFPEGSKLRDAYSGKTTKIINGIATIDTDFPIVLFEKLK